MATDEEQLYVTRAGRKLAHGLRVFEVEAADKICADLGSHVGGFVDCLLQHGAAKVYSVDTSYGILAWKLRKDERVVVMERTNAMHVELPEPVDIVTIDVGWTPQKKILPRALSLLKPDGLVIALIKPQYESQEHERHKGVVLEAHLPAVTERVRHSIASCGARIEGETTSPIKGAGGNVELLFLLRPEREPRPGCEDEDNSGA